MPALELMRICGVSSLQSSDNSRHATYDCRLSNRETAGYAGIGATTEKLDMAGRQVCRAIALLFVIAGFVVPVHASAVPTTADALTVTWPEVTQFNPDTTPYVIDVSYSGEGTLFLLYNRNLTLETLDPSGTHTVVFPAFERNSPNDLSIVECPGATYSWDCSIVAHSPSLRIYSDAVPYIHLGMIGDSEVGPTETIPFTSYPSTLGT